MTAAWKFTLTCSYCGALCEPRNLMPSNGSECRVLADCTECDGEMLVVVVLRPAHRQHTNLDPPVWETCGRNSGYVRHQKRGETPCQPCRDAHTAYQRELRARRQQVAA